MPCDNHRRLEILDQAVPKQDPAQRVKNWDEAFLGYDLEAAIVSADTAVLAIGYGADELLEDTTPGLHTDKRSHLIRVEDDYSTSRRGVFAGGDNVNGADLVVTAPADGRRASGAIHRYLESL